MTWETVNNMENLEWYGESVMIWRIWNGMENL